MFIILTKAQADALRGMTSGTTALMPVPLKNGTEWALPAKVLDDPAHASKRRALAAITKRELTKADWPDPDPIE